MYEASPHVVTLGGGHGQAALLSALGQLACRITAVVSVADDGGCSGRLRDEMGMPPPGDVRRCLTALARDRTLADRFEVRLDPGPDSARRSAGNLAISEAFVELGTLQGAVDWAAELLQCRGRVVPVAEAPGVLAVYDMAAGAIEGETTVEQRSASPMVAVVHGPERANPAAVEAIAEADYVLMGPGSFITSTLATLTTAEVAEAIVDSRATRVMMHNLRDEPGQTEGFCVDDYVRLLRDHLVIKTGEPEIDFAVLRHAEPTDAGTYRRAALGDGTAELWAPLAAPGSARHDPDLLARALAHHLALSFREETTLPRPPASWSQQAFTRHVQRARLRLSELGGG